MVALTTQEIIESNKGQVIKVLAKISVTKEGVFSTTLDVKDVEKIKSYGITLECNRMRREGYFSALTLEDLIDSIRSVLKECISCEIVKEERVIRYQINTYCSYVLGVNGDICPNGYAKWTGSNDYTHGCNWRSGTVETHVINRHPYGFLVYAKPFLKVTSKFGSGKEIVEYKDCPAEEGSAIDWLSCVPDIAIANNPGLPLKEVECTEATAAFFVKIIKAICRMNEQIKDFLDPDTIVKLAEQNINFLNEHNNVGI